MKNCWLLICISFLIGCKKEDNTSPFIPFENCNFITESSAPTGFNIGEIAVIEDNVYLKDIQFISESVGYLFAGNNVGGYAEVYKTVDGGQKWQDLSLNFDESPLSLLFINENIGLLSHYGSRGNLMRTEDGGDTWKPYSFSTFYGNLYHLIKDNQENIYGIASNLNTPTTIVKSTDHGLSWTVFKKGLDIDFSLIRSGIHLIDDKIYVTVKEGQLLKLNETGTLEEIIETGLEMFWDIKLIDGKNFVLVGDSKVIKSNDGGLNWQEIHNRTARIIEFSSPEEGWMLLNKSACNTDVYQVNDVLAYTNDGGLTWQESEERTNWMTDYNGHHKNLTDNYLITFGNSIFQLGK